MAKKILITGANAGLGKESARQFAEDEATELIILGVRNLEKGAKAQRELEQQTGRKIFELLKIDVSNVESVRKAVVDLKANIDGLVLNAGGIGGATPMAKSKSGVTDIAAVNLLGHTVLVDELIQQGKLSGVVVYAGSEVARGVAKFGLQAPKFKEWSQIEFDRILNGSFFDEKVDPMVVYGYVKYLGTLWISAQARLHPEIRFVTVSPGATTGTEAAKDANVFYKFLMRTKPGQALGGLFGLTHGLSVGAKRYVDVVNNDSYQSGKFFGSKDPKSAVGELADQGLIDQKFYDQAIQKSLQTAIAKYAA